MRRRPKGDAKLLQIVDAAFADAARRSGDWLLCRPGCTQCCYGPFPISQLDAARLRDGMEHLQEHDPARADRVRERAEAYIERLRNDFPGDPESGILGDDEQAESRFEDFADDEPCPALDPTTGTCDVYEFRPMTCRTFGPPVRSGPENGLGVCELCFKGATNKQIAACEMVPDSEDREAKLIEQAGKKSGVRGNTIVAYCLREPTRS